MPGNARLGVGIVGVGAIGSVHARNVALSASMRLLAVHDASIERARHIAEVHSVRCEQDVEGLANARDVDAVIISSPTATHCDLVQTVAAAGKAIYCEKPIDLDLAKARRAAAIVAQAGTPFMMGFNRRYEPAYASLREAVRSGALGRPQIMQMSSRGPQQAPDPSYIAGSGGIFRDKGVHFFDLVRFVLDDEPERLSSMGSVLTDPFMQGHRDYDTATVMIRMRSGALAVIDNARRASYGYDERIEIFGSAGLMEAPRLPRSANLRTSGLRLESSDFPQNLLERAGASYALALEAFAALVMHGRQGVPGLADGLAAQTMAEAATAAAQSGSILVASHTLDDWKPAIPE